MVCLRPTNFFIFYFFVIGTFNFYCLSANFNYAIQSNQSPCYTLDSQAEFITGNFTFYQHVPISPTQPPPPGSAITILLLIPMSVIFCIFLLLFCFVFFFFFFCFCFYLILYISDLVQYLYFCLWLVSLSIHHANQIIPIITNTMIFLYF